MFDGIGRKSAGSMRSGDGVAFKLACPPYGSIQGIWKACVNSVDIAPWWMMDGFCTVERIHEDHHHEQQELGHYDEMHSNNIILFSFCKPSVYSQFQSHDETRHIC